MRTLKTNPLVDKIYLILLFILASLCLYHGFRPIILIFTHEARLSMVLKTLPLIIANGLPFTFLLSHWRRMHVKNISTKYKLYRSFSITVLIQSALGFITQLVSCATQIGWGLFKGVSGLYPYDLLVITFVLIIYSILCLVSLNKNKDLKRVPLTFKGERKSTLVLFTLFLGFSCYEVGNVIYNSISAFGDGMFDPNVGLMVPTILLLLTPSFYLVIYLLYKNHFNSRKFFKWSLVGLIIYTFVIVSVVLIIFILNPTYIAESMAGFMELGFTIKTPLDLIVVPVILIIILIASTVNYVVLSRRDKYEQE